MVVSIVTPSFNQTKTRYLKYCVRSVAPEHACGGVEHFVIDGGTRIRPSRFCEKMRRHWISGSRRRMGPKRGNQ
jgi:hypothetical protein